MSSIHPITPPTVEPTRDLLAPNGALACKIDMDHLRTMSAGELRDLREVLHCVSDVVTGLMGQPRFWAEEGYNAPGSALVRLGEFLDTYEQGVVNVATAYVPLTEDDARDRAWTILGFEAEMRECLGAFSALAADCERDLAVLRSKTRRRGSGRH